MENLYVSGCLWGQSACDCIFQGLLLAAVLLLLAPLQWSTLCHWGIADIAVFCQPATFGHAHYMLCARCGPETRLRLFVPCMLMCPTLRCGASLSGAALFSSCCLLSCCGCCFAHSKARPVHGTGAFVPCTAGAPVCTAPRPLICELLYIKVGSLGTRWLRLGMMPTLRVLGGLWQP